MVHKRLSYYFENQNLTKKEIAKKIDVAYNHFVTILSGTTVLGLNIFKKIKKEFPDLNSEWVFFGNGNMNLTDLNLPVVNESMTVYGAVDPNNHEHLNIILTNSIIDKEKIIKNLEKENYILTKKIEALEYDDMIEIKSDLDRRVEVSEHNQ